MTQPRNREEQIAQDVKDLHGLGYAQELYRTMGGFSNFAISFSIISILTGAVILYDYGLAWAGTAAVLLGWPLVTVFVLLIAASMSEVASAYPTAGGLYYWASKMKNKNWGWWTAWLNLIGQFAIVAGINFAAAAFLNGTIITPLLNNAGIDYQNTTLVLGQSWLTGQLLTMGVLMLVELVLNIAGINLVAFLNQVSVWWHIAVRRSGRDPHLRRRQARHQRPDPVLHPAPGRGRQLGEQQPPVQAELRPRDLLSGGPGLPLLAPAGELDVHGL